MKPVLILASLLASLLQTGCYLAPLSLENGGEAIAASIGEPTENLMFVSNADLSLTESFPGEFSILDRGVLAVSKDAIYWQPGQDAYDPKQTITVVRLESVHEFAPDGDLIQLRIENDLYVVQFVGWNSTVASQPRAEAFRELLLAKQVPQFAADLSYKPSKIRTRRSSRDRSLEADYLSNPEVGLAQDTMDQNNYDWASTFGDDGVVTSSP